MTGTRPTEPEHNSTLSMRENPNGSQVRNLLPLPIDEHLSAIEKGVELHAKVIIEAEPGAGKTTRIPSRLLDAPFLEGEILVSEPRRIAAKMAASRVAEERGSRLGEEVGYRVRFDERVGPKTRLTFLTEGLLLSRLLEDFTLPSVGLVVLDEVHERSADLDVCLALLQKTLEARAGFRLVCMSATMDAEALAAYLGGAARFCSEGRAHPVRVEHLPSADDRPLELQVRSAVTTAQTQMTAGDTLIFLPGEREIHRCAEALREKFSLPVLPLHGNMTLEQQTLVMRQGSGPRKIILSTNLAESSVTLPAVTVVIDSGLGRSAVYDAWAGISRLETASVSRARMIQRTGRAGRVGPGLCLRLFTRGHFEAQKAQETPELLRQNLSLLLLRLLSSGQSPDALTFLSAPEKAAWMSAQAELTFLSAFDPKKGELTPIGRAMAPLPLSPRLSRILVEGKQLGILSDAALAASLLEERDVLLSARGRNENLKVVSGDSDIADRLERLREWDSERGSAAAARRLDLDAALARRILQSAQASERAALRSCVSLPELRTGADPLTRALMTGFPDRVAERRGGGTSLVLTTGTQVELSRASSVTSAALLLAVSTDAPGGRARHPLVRLACRLEPEWLMECFSSSIEATETFSYNSEKGRVESVSRLAYGRVTLDESKSSAPPGEQCAEVLSTALLSRGAAVFDPNGHLLTLSRRLGLLLEHEPEKVPAEMRDSIGNLADLSAFSLKTAALTHSTLADIQAVNLAEEILTQLPGELSRLLRTSVPLEVTLPHGRKLEIHYEEDRLPWIESRLQDFFSLSQAPSLCSGRLPLQVHLLAPNKRAVQITTDLGGFWQRHYPELRKQLMRRYPKHLWPEDGLSAKPPTPGKIR